jgi:hypothetical protein
MANRDNPSGLKVARHARGGLTRPNRYFIASALASNIFRGDPVIPVNTSKRINVATAGARLIGVFAQVLYVNVAGEVKFDKFWPSGQTLQTGSVAEALVWDDPETLFEVQHSGVMAIADVGAFFDVTMATAGNAMTGISGAEADTATLSTADGQLRFEQIVDRPDNELGTNGKGLFVINEHFLRGALTGV